MKKKIFVYLLVVTFALGVTGCGSDKNSNSFANNEKTEVSKTSYVGTYKNNDSSFIEITKNNDTYKANISIYRLTTFDDCEVSDIKDDILNISCKDGNDNTIKFTFDYKTKILTVEETTWSLLNDGDTFEFND